MAQASSTLECPVCSDLYNNPKLLVCNHIICGKCILDWLGKTKGSGGCPLCRAPILSPSTFHQDDLEDLVDTLPTDLTIMAKVESTKMLGSRCVCMSCDNNVTATSFCLQCNMKLCKSCAKNHRKFPSMKNHVVEELDSLTPERLAEVNHSTCKSHDDRLAELYCSTHQELICLLCSSTNHRVCTEVRVIKEAAAEKREKFREEAQRLREKEPAMRAKIMEAKAKLAEMRTKANKKFDTLQQCVERRRQEVNDLILAEEVQQDLAQQDQVRAATLSQTVVLDSLVGEAPDDALLDMEKAMTSRLQDLQQRITETDKIQGPAYITVDSQKLTVVKSAIATLGTRSNTPPEQSPASGSSGPKPREKALAEVLKVGDHVRLRMDMWWPSAERGRRGIVTAVPSSRVASRGEDARGFVDVRWDDGEEECHYMGRGGQYDLDLA
ncbi:E3 ubiquitin/ISG15 ligase TRIM25-like [Babylonia areolata]|uniref:E3 ubiquitin/ISG15 ligase TRIM25-like n=1 Tax=Babylonia areolata TaxID=304850 RepID=UPI003FD315EF